MVLPWAFLFPTVRMLVSTVLCKPRCRLVVLCIQRQAGPLPSSSRQMMAKLLQSPGHQDHLEAEASEKENTFPLL